METVQVFAETHQIAAGQNFTGEVPVDPFVIHHGHAIAPAGAKGGLFSLDLYRDTESGLFVPGRMFELGFFRVLQGVRITFGGQSSWTLKIVGRVGSHTLANGTTETSFLTTSAEYYLLLTPDEYLELKTVGASAAMRATVLFESWRQVH